MRQRRQKRTRRAVKYYKVVHRFKEPYKVLLDGNFLHACQALKLGDVREAVGKLLGGAVRVFVTKCVQAELRELGPDYAETLRAARQLEGIAGGLEPPASAAASLEAAVGPSNAEHFFVGTQDLRLRERLRKVPAVPLLFVHSLGVGLEPPTEAQKEEAAPRGAVPAHEADALALEPGAALRVSTTVRFKRNVAKGPNPLAAKKKRKVAPPARPASAPETEGGERQRKRRRRGGAGGGGAELARG